MLKAIHNRLKFLNFQARELLNTMLVSKKGSYIKWMGVSRPLFVKN
jgi:hypothetical protein